MSDVRSVVAVTGLDFEARIAKGPHVRTVACGGDRGALAAALERELARGATAILSFGLFEPVKAVPLPKIVIQK